MFVNCFEISISAIVKHVQLESSVLFVCLGGLAKFFSAWDHTKKLLGLDLLGGSVPRLALFVGLLVLHLLPLLNPWLIIEI